VCLCVFVCVCVCHREDSECVGVCVCVCECVYVSKRRLGAVEPCRALTFCQTGWLLAEPKNSVVLDRTKYSVKRAMYCVNRAPYSEFQLTNTSHILSVPFSKNFER